MLPMKKVFLILLCLSIETDQEGKYCVVIIHTINKMQPISWQHIKYAGYTIYFQEGSNCIGSTLQLYKAYTSTQKVSTFKYLVGLFFFLGLELSNMIYTYLLPPVHTSQIFGILSPLFPACYYHLLQTLASTYSIASLQSKHSMLV